MNTIASYFFVNFGDVNWPCRRNARAPLKVSLIRFRDSKTTGPQPGVFLVAASFLSGGALTSSFDQNLVETETPLAAAAEFSLSAAAA